MTKPAKKPEEILDEQIAYLLTGGSFADAKKKMPNARALLASLLIAEKAFKIPVKKTLLDQTRVWDKISRGINENSNAGFQQNPASAFLPIFRLFIPKTLLAAVMATMLIWVLNSTAVAAQNSLPGQTLYPVKRTVEKIQLTLTVNEVQKTEVRIRQAETRLLEAQSIVESQGADDEKIIERTLNELKDATTQVAEESTNNQSLLQKVVELTDKQETVLSDIETKVTGDTRIIVGKTLDAAAETKSSALAKLENISDPQASTTATSTPDNLGNSTTTPVQNVPGKNNEGTTTSTDNTLQKLGNPSETSTPVIFSPFQSFDPQTTTSQIIELK